MSGQTTMKVQEISRLDFGRLAKERNRKYKSQKIFNDPFHEFVFLYIGYKILARWNNQFPYLWVFPF